MALHTITRKIKAALVAAPDPDMWVRGWRDGSAWVGTNRTFHPDHSSGRAQLIEHLTAAGFKCTDITVSGSSFQFCIEVRE